MKFPFKNRLKNAWRALNLKEREFKPGNIDQKKVAIFVICVILAFCLWLVVSLNRNYTVNIDVPLKLGNISTKKALAEEIPSKATVTVSGLGWRLINLWDNPPKIMINVTSRQVDLLQEVRNRIDNQNIRVQKVVPFSLQPRLVPRHTKKVPVIPRVSVKFDKQYGFIEPPTITPDSVIISGGKAQIQGIKNWPTEPVSLKNVNEDVSLEIPLKEAKPLVQLSLLNVNYHASVVKLTTDEVTVQIKRRGFPAGKIVTFIPSSVTIEYQVPLKEYDEINNGHPFKAYITYQQLKSDSTGFLKPHIKQLAKNVHLKIRSVKPSEVNYFVLVGNKDLTEF